MSNFKDYLNVYEFETVLPGSGETVKFKPIITGQIKKLLTYENSTSEEVDIALDNLITSSVISEGFDINRLYIQDRFFLLVELRKMSKGSTYQFSAICQKCKSQMIVNVDLKNIEVIPYNVENDTIKLDDNISIKLKHITRGDQKQSFDFIKKGLSDTQKMAEMMIGSYASSITSITTPEGEDENIDIADKIYFINNLPQGMYEKVTTWSKENDFGLNFSYDTVCRSCGNKKTIDIPLENFFF